MHDKSFGKTFLGARFVEKGPKHVWMEHCVTRHLEIIF